MDLHLTENFLQLNLKVVQVALPRKEELMCCLRVVNQASPLAILGLTMGRLNEFQTKSWKGQTTILVNRELSNYKKNGKERL
jgi:hypothetical protein